MKTMDLKIRPIHHRLAKRVRSHVLFCMLAYYVEGHMRDALAPILFDDHEHTAAQEAGTSNVAPAQRSDAPKRKAASKSCANGTPVHSFQTMLADLATIVRNRMRPRGGGHRDLRRDHYAHRCPAPRTRTLGCVPPLSGYSEVEMAQDALNGPTEFLEKPFEIVALNEKLEQALAAGAVETSTV